jgi:indole-3-glycerol phosphate synthase
MNLPEDGPKGKSAAVLDRILAGARARLPELRARRGALERQAVERPRPPAFAAALRGAQVALIAEVKRRSPSAGVIAPGLDAVSQALAYVRAGAAAVSVLTEPDHFGGSLADLAAVTASTTAPVLRKDFIVDELQLVEARAAGAAAALLIVRALPPRRLAELVRFAQGLGLETLVEVHDRRELDTALAAGAQVVGVNSRDLASFRIDVAAAWALLEQVPAERVAVAESGMSVPEDVARAAAHGADAVLIGTALSSAPDPAALVAGFAGIARRAR